MRRRHKPLGLILDDLDRRQFRAKTPRELSEIVARAMAWIDGYLSEKRVV